MVFVNAALGNLPLALELHTVHLYLMLVVLLDLSLLFDRLLNWCFASLNASADISDVVYSSINPIGKCIAHDCSQLSVSFPWLVARLFQVPIA